MRRFNCQQNGVIVNDAFEAQTYITMVAVYVYNFIRLTFISRYWTLQTNTAMLCSIQVSLPLSSVQMFIIEHYLETVKSNYRVSLSPAFQLQPFKDITYSTTSFKLHPNSVEISVSKRSRVHGCSIGISRIIAGMSSFCLHNMINVNILIITF